MINNWIDEKEIYPLDADNERVHAFRRQYDLEDKFVIMYSGNIGLYYDLENLLKVIEKFKPGTKTADGREVAFAFVGGGAVLDKLVLYKNEHHMDNVVFIPFQDKSELIYSLNAGDVHWVVNSKGIKGISCPSKFYGVVACAKPVLGVLEEGSEIRCIIEEAGCGLVCESGAYDKVEENIQWFIDNANGGKVAEMGRGGRKYLEKHLAKEVSVQKYIEAIKGI
jgi:glycosyltransferase involved in cell wall biosynthesis